MKLEARKSRILFELLKDRGSVTGDYLARILNVSSRTIRNDMKLIETELKKHGVNLLSIPGVGYSVEVSSQEELMQLTKAVFETENDYILPSMPDDRVNYIIKKLLCACDFITMEQLADNLYVSKSTIDKDIPKVEIWLKQHNLALLKRPNYGLKIIGEELALRYAIADFLKIYRDPLAMLDIEKLKDIIKGEDVTKIQWALTEAYQEHPFKLSDMAYTNLIIHIAIAIRRILEGSILELPFPEMEKVKDKPEFELARKIIRKIEPVIPVIFPEIEILYITLHLLGMQVLEDEKIDADTISKMVDNELVLCIKGMLVEISRTYQIELSQDKELLSGLILHLRTTINRLTYKMSLKNPMLDEIKEEYLQAFDMAIIAARHLERCYQVIFDENEIGYLAIHFGAAIERQKNLQKSRPKNVVIVCASGMGSAQLLAAKIRRMFSQLTILGVYPAYKLALVKNLKPDFIISTVFLQEDEIPVIQVSTILTKRDMEMLSCYASERSDFLDSGNKELIAKLCRTETILTALNVQNPAEVIRILGDKLLDYGAVDNEFVNSVLERETISSTAIGNLVAIPHALLNHAIDSHIAIAILEKPVKWGENSVQLVFLLAFDIMCEQDIEAVFTQLYKIVNDRQLVNNMIYAKNAAQVMQLLGQGV